jgi:hypothetical protein
VKSVIGLLSSIVFVLSISGCSKDSGTSGRTEAVASPRQYIILLDLSMSRSDAVRSEGVDFLNRLSNNLSFGDHVTVLQVQQTGLTDHPKRWADSMPLPVDSSYVTSRDKKQLAAEQESVRDAIKGLSQLPPGHKVLHTDLITTLNLSGEYAHDFSPQRTTVILLSDMLQSSTSIEMEHLKRMPQASWVDAQKKLGLIPKLSGACVVVVGADATTRDGAKVRDFWQSYFTAAGADLSPANYRATPPAGGNASCEAD